MLLSCGMVCKWNCKNKLNSCTETNEQMALCCLPVNMWLPLLNLVSGCYLTVVQFYYGEDGLDVMNVSYLKQYGFMANNAAATAAKVNLAGARTAAAALGTGAVAEEQAVARALKVRSKLQKQVRKGHQDAVQQLNKAVPLMAEHWPSVLGATSEAFADALNQYCADNPDKLLVADTDANGKHHQGKEADEKHKKRDKKTAAAAEGLVDTSGGG